MFSLIMPLGAVVLLLVMARRFLRHRESFEEFRARKAREHNSQMRGLHQANAALSPAEALLPVAAGLRELAAKARLRFTLGSEGGDLLIRQEAEQAFGPDKPPVVLRVRWVVRAVRVPNALRQTGPRVAGHWELCVAGGPAQPFTDLARLMRELETRLVP